MNKLAEYLSGKHKVAIAGHVSPDGDCIGACLGLWNYLQDNYPQIDAVVYMQSLLPIYGFLRGADRIRADCTETEAKQYDMMILLDISSTNRIGVAGPVFENCGCVLCLDHHKTNPGGFTFFCNDPAASSASEVLYRFLEPEKISKYCAEALYMGIAHDTGVFRYSSTSPETMRVAASLMEKGLDHSRIIDETFYQKSFAQKKIQGHVIDNSRLYLDGRFIVGTATRKERAELGLKASELDGIVSVLRDTIGVEAAMFLYELDTGEIKVSLRSRAVVDVSEICSRFGGGGHARAAGCNRNADMEEIIRDILPMVQEQLERAEEWTVS